MYTYDTPLMEEYVIPSVAFGAGSGTTTHNIIGPKGLRGRVTDIQVQITANMVGTSAVPEIAVGASAGNAEYARFRLGTAAGAGYTTTPPVRRATQEIGANNVFSKTDFAGHVELQKADIPADTAFTITAKEGSGGSPAGTGITRVSIAWFQ